MLVKGDAELCAADGEKNHWDEADRARYYSEKVAVRTLDEIKQIKQFNRYFDAWLVDVRLQKFYLSPDDS